MMKMTLIGAAVVAATVAVAGCGKEDAAAKDEAAAKPSEAATEVKAEQPAAPELPKLEVKDPKEVLVKVGDRQITRGELEETAGKFVEFQAKRVPAEQKAMFEQQKGMMIAQQVGQLARQFLFENVLVAKAKAAGLSVTDEDMKAKEAAYAKFAAESKDMPKTLAECMASNHPLGQERGLEEIRTSILLEKYFDKVISEKDKKDYTADAQAIVDGIKAQNAKCMTEAAAEAKIKELKATLDKTPTAEQAKKFGELAEEFSACPSGKRDKGNLGPFGRKVMDPIFEKAAFELPVGKISEPVKSSFGWHLILTTAKTPEVKDKDGKVLTNEQVTASHILLRASEPKTVPELEDVKRTLRQRANQPLIREVVDEMILEAKPVVADEFKQFLPQKKPAAKPAEKPAEKPAVETLAK